jgi:hypothetical protein
MSIGGSSGAKRAESKPTFVRAETGIFGDEQNPAGLRLGETAEEYANLLQQQTVPPHPVGQAQFPPQLGLTDSPIGAEYQQSLLNPSFAPTAVQQPMIDALRDQLTAKTAYRGIQPTTAGMSAGIAPLLNQLSQQRIENLQKAAIPQFEQRLGQRAGDIGGQLQFADIQTAGDIARKNITLNSLMALANLSKPTIIGGQEAYGAKAPDFQWSVTGEDIAKAYGASQGGSDSNLKENISVMENPIEQLRKIKIY